ncbi:MAG: hypothetical protein M1819_000176 [Sarea resinae]|nr:MAG: hypothetical protein M1819_000176 [Sarea resinae]
MRALEPEVLQEALTIQDGLLGPTEDYTRFLYDAESLNNSLPEVKRAADEGAGRDLHRLGANETNWFFHSPLMYWDCSSSAIAQDGNIVETVNYEGGRRTTPQNTTLRPTMVFAGKSFKDDRIVAADALVISLFYRPDTEVGHDWEERVQGLIKTSDDRWTLFSSEGKSPRSRLYEYRFQPMSFQDDFFLALAYLAMALYVVSSLKRLSAVKNRIGLIVTVITQITTSILASFTICAFLNIDLSEIPREAYPFVVFAIGLENMFRLINAVLVTSPEMPTSYRIANALGDIGHHSIAAAAQNLLMLWLFSQLVSPGVAAFCAFAAVALVFDFFFHLTFFVAVLSVDVRRMELQDSLDRITIGQYDKSESSRLTWKDALFQGNIPFSTRIAGTAIMIAFIVALNWHFFDNDNPFQTFSRLLRLFHSSGDLDDPDGTSIMPSRLNPARSPNAWFRLQGHDTTKEFMRLVKPQAHSFIARVYDPLVFVLDGADRADHATPGQRFYHVFFEAVEEHLLPFLLSFVIIIAGVTLLMNFMLWNEIIDDVSGSPDGDEPGLNVKTVFRTHELDVVLLAACPKGTWASVGLDRTICIWSLRNPVGRAERQVISGPTMNPLWPIVAAALHESGDWLAVCSYAGRIAIWSVLERRFVYSMMVDLAREKPCSFFFAPSQQEIQGAQDPRLILIRPDGWMADMDLRSGDSRLLQICKNRLVCAQVINTPKSPLRIITASRSGCMHLASRTPTEWISDHVEVEEPRLFNGKMPRVKAVFPIPALGMILAVKLCEVDLIDLQSRTVLRTFQTGQVKNQTLRALHSIRRLCPACGAPGVASLSIVYTEAETQNCMLHTFTPGRPGALICLRPDRAGRGFSCVGIESTSESLHWVENANVWETTSINAVLGVRKRPSVDTDSSSGGNSSDRDECSLGSSLRRRRSNQRPHKYLGPPRGEVEDVWEAWTMSASGEITTTLLAEDHNLALTHATSMDGKSKACDNSGFTRNSPSAMTATTTTSSKTMATSGEELLVSHAGPIVRLGARSVAVGFGNAVKVVMFGNERFSDCGSAEGGAYEDLEFAALGHRRRTTGRLKNL